MVSRRAWIEQSHFHDLSTAQVLEEVARRVREPPEQPLVLFDLDSTLYEVGPRTFAILREWMQSASSAGFPALKSLFEKMDSKHVGYSVADTVRALGGDPAQPEIASAMHAIKDFWAKRFFSSAYLPYDRAYPGAARFVQNVYALGAQIVYLTGRDEPGMGEGTRANLHRDHFPWERERTHLLLKPRFHVPDLQHKVDAAHYIRKHGTLIASFENEPANIVGLYQAFPDAMHVFIETVCSDHEAQPLKNLYRIHGFTENP